MMCKFCPDKPATHTRLVVDPENSGQHANQIAYKRIGMCDLCTAEAQLYIGNTAAIQPIESEVPHAQNLQS